MKVFWKIFEFLFVLTHQVSSGSRIPDLLIWWGSMRLFMGLKTWDQSTFAAGVPHAWWRTSFDSMSKIMATIREGSVTLSCLTGSNSSPVVCSALWAVGPLNTRCPLSLRWIIIRSATSSTNRVRSTPFFFRSRSEEGPTPKRKSAGVCSNIWIIRNTNFIVSYFKSKWHDSVQLQTVMALFDEIVRNSWQTSYLRLKTSLNLHID